jgi:hypothetical protein
MVLYFILKIFYLDFILYAIFCSCFKKFVDQRTTANLLLFDGKYKLTKALSTRASYKNYVLRQLQFKQLLERNIEQFSSLNDYYVQNLQRDRLVLMNKLQQYNNKVNKKELENNFDDRIEFVMNNFNVIEKNPLQFNFSYNIAHIPEYEAYTV